jgi:hypothetical protein
MVLQIFNQGAIGCKETLGVVKGMHPEDQNCLFDIRGVGISGGITLFLWGIAGN